MLMRETVKENADRKNEKIVEVFNEKLEENGLQEKKIDVTNVSVMNKAKNLVSVKKYQQKPGAKQPKIYSIADLMELL